MPTDDKGVDHPDGVIAGTSQRPHNPPQNVRSTTANEVVLASSGRNFSSVGMVRFANDLTFLARDAAPLFG